MTRNWSLEASGS
ncbi:hypothetical protein LEMLEM_LOCUS9646 [Lemmus lemmus]